MTAALDFVDASLGQMEAALAARSLASRTLIVVAAKHGQSPIDPALRRIVDSKTLASAISAAATPGALAQLTTDTVGLMWLRGGDAQAVADASNAQENALWIDHVLVGPALQAMFGDPANDPRVPDLVVAPLFSLQAGVIGSLAALPAAVQTVELRAYTKQEFRERALMGSRTVAVTPLVMRALESGRRDAQVTSSPTPSAAGWARTSL